VYSFYPPIFAEASFQSIIYGLFLSITGASSQNNSIFQCYSNLSHRCEKLEPQLLKDHLPWQSLIWFSIGTSEKNVWKERLQKNFPDSRKVGLIYLNHLNNHRPLARWHSWLSKVQGACGFERNWFLQLNFTQRSIQMAIISILPNDKTINIVAFSIPTIVYFPSPICQGPHLKSLEMKSP